MNPKNGSSSALGSTSVTVSESETLRFNGIWTLALLLVPMSLLFMYICKRARGRANAAETNLRPNAELPAPAPPSEITSPPMLILLHFVYSY
ncbi:hypothetical protein V6N13_065220 [Hibiscus sabdariffa]